MENLDFPRYLFPFVKERLVPDSERPGAASGLLLDGDDDAGTDPYSICERIVKLSYNWPVRIDFEPSSVGVRCLAHKYQSSDFVRPLTPVMPWRLDSSDSRPKAGASYYQILSLSSIARELAALIERQEEEEEDSESAEAASFYYVVCNSIRAKFFPSLFARGNRGKCVYTGEGLWMTPLEFKTYCGSNAADWRHVLKLVRPERNQTRQRRSKRLSVKTLIDERKLALHPPSCTCPQCTESEFLQSQNLQLFSSFFLNSYQELYTVSPNMTHPAHLDIAVYSGAKAARADSVYDLLEKANYEVLSQSRTNATATEAKRSFRSLSRTLKWSDDKSKSSGAIKQISARCFDEESGGSNDVYECFVSVNLDDARLVSLHLESLDASDDADELPIRPIFNLQMASPFRIKTVASSPMIRGECAFLLDASSDIYLANEESVGAAPCQFGSASCRLRRLASGLSPLFDVADSAAARWRHVQFGTQPRSIVYADYSQMVCVDARAKTVGSQMAKELFRPSTKWLDVDELIGRAAIVESEPNMHLIACTKTLLVIDERFPGRPLLAWKHHLESGASFLNSLSLPSASRPEQSTHLALLSDARDVYMHQFSTKLHDAPVSHNFPRRLSSARELLDGLPQSYDKRLSRNLSYRLEAPVISLSTLQYKNSFALFQMLDKQDVYYQCFQVEPTEVPGLETADMLARTKRGPKILAKWLDKVKAKSFRRTAIDLEADFEEMNLNQTEAGLERSLDRTLPASHHLCQLCNPEPTGVVKTDYSEQEEASCPRCGFSLAFSFAKDSCSTDNLTADLTLFASETASNEAADNFTDSILEIWKI